jgi:hypothetical protein
MFLSGYNSKSALQTATADICTGILAYFLYKGHVNRITVISQQAEATLGK